MCRTCSSQCQWQSTRFISHLPRLLLPFMRRTTLRRRLIRGPTRRLSTLLHTHRSNSPHNTFMDWGLPPPPEF